MYKNVRSDRLVYPIPGSGRDDDDKSRVAGGGRADDCRCGGQGEADMGGPARFSSAFGEADYTWRSIYTSTFIIILSTLPPVFAPFPAASLLFSPPCSHSSPRSHPEHHSSAHTYIVIPFSPPFPPPHPPQSPSPTSAPPQTLAEPANN